MAGFDEGTLDGVPLVREGFPRTVRLVTSARLREAVMAPLADTQDPRCLMHRRPRFVSATRSICNA